jgi:hypothetical protein
MSVWRRFQRLSSTPRQRYSDEVILFADSSGALKTVDEDGTVAAVAGAGSLPSPTDDGDVLTVVSGDWAGAAPGGGSQPLKVVRFPFAFDTPGLTGAYPITAVDAPGGTITIAGDHAAVLTAAGAFSVTGSTGNDGSFSVVSATFAAGSTTIDAGGPLFDATADGDVIVCGQPVVYTPTVGDRLGVDSVISVYTAFDGNSPRLTVMVRGADPSIQEIMDCDATDADGPVFGGSWNRSATTGATGGSYAVDTTPIVLLLDDGGILPPGSIQGEGEVFLVIYPAP